jgi:D-alanine transaminase/branched-chain amino acid aminotransferase
MHTNFTFLNGEFVPLNQSFLHVSDLVIQRGYAVFDFFLVRNKVPPYLSFHLDRFIKSASLLHLDLPYTKEELSSIVYELIEKNNLQNSSVKIMLTGGISTDDFTVSKPSLLVINKPFETTLSDPGIDSATLITSNYQREMPEAKTVNYLRSISLAKQIKDSKAIEVLYLDRNWVRECSRSNVFLVKNGSIYTPKSKMLKGITRKRILSLEGLSVHEKDFKFKDLLNADEVFISSTTKGVLPITKINSRIISNGQVGKITKELQKIIL